MTGYGEAVCTECDTTSPRLLPARFPHICIRCLFPSQAQSGLMLSDLYARIPRTHTTSSAGDPQ